MKQEPTAADRATRRLHLHVASTLVAAPVTAGALVGGVMSKNIAMTLIAFSVVAFLTYRILRVIKND